MATSSTGVSYGAGVRSFSQGAVVVLGRFLYVLLFLMAGPIHFSKQEIGYAVSAGVPLASILVPFSGVLALAGGLSILLGYRAKLGAWLVVLFLVPVTLMMHKFWGGTRSYSASTDGHVHEKYVYARRRVTDFSVWCGTVQS